MIDDGEWLTMIMTEMINDGDDDEEDDNDDDDAPSSS